MNNFTRYFKDVCYGYLLLCIIFIPFQYYLLPFQQQVADYLFGNILTRLASLLHVQVVQKSISSDSATLYMLMLWLMIVAFLLVTILSFSNVWKNRRERIHKVLTTVFTYFLSLQLLKYGFDKIFKAQFYLPEPNTLYTPLGHLSKDILFWSTMGTSYPYNLFMGFAEVIPAVLLLFKRTRTIGLIWTFAVLINVVAVNFSFDISVKIFSLFLLGITLFLLGPQLKVLFQFLILQKTVSLPVEKPTPVRSVFLSTTLNVFIVGLLFLEALYPYLTQGNYNDDKVSRPPLHGVYEVKEVWVDSLQVEAKDIDYKYFFVHRQGYFIVQYKNDKMEDAPLIIDTVQHRWITKNDEGEASLFSYTYSVEDSMLTLVTTVGNQRKLIVKAKALDWRKLPALQHDFHWTIDEIK